MKIIICVAGQVGVSIASHLSEEENDVTFIEQNQERLRKVLDHSALEARLRLPERQIDSIPVCSKVFIYSLQNIKKSVEGKIARIDNMASLMNPRNRNSIKYHWAFLDLNSKSLQHFQPGETLLAEIQLGYHKDCWVIPKELAVIKQDSLVLNTSLGKKYFNDSK